MRMALICLYICRLGPQFIELFEKHWVWPCWRGCATGGRLEISQCALCFPQVAQDMNSQLFCCHAFVLPSWTLNLWNHKPNYMLSSFKKQKSKQQTNMINPEPGEFPRHTRCSSQPPVTPAPLGAPPYLAYTHKNTYMSKNTSKINKK